MAARIGILAGGGDLPARLIAVCRSLGREIFVVAFEGSTDPKTVEGAPHFWTRLGAAGAILDRLRAEGVEEIVMTGRIRRPSLSELRPDWRAARFFARVGTKALGDDGLLRAVTGTLEEEGFRVVGIQEIFKGFLMPSGPLTIALPDETARRDIAVGLDVARTLGALDVGQAVVAQQGLILGVEAIEGTDALITRCADLRRSGEGGVLVKISKPQQDRRLDLPTIGPVTVCKAVEAGLRGLAVEAGGALLVDRDEVVELADRAGLFIVGIDVNT